MKAYGEAMQHYIEQHDPFINRCLWCDKEINSESYETYCGFKHAGWDALSGFATPFVLIWEIAKMIFRHKESDEE